MKIGVAMSGGVDSSVAACLLLEQKHDVTGFTMRHFDNEAGGFAPDDGVEAAIRDAGDVCRQLGIEHHVIDVRQDFERIVIADFIAEYERGHTPNPCCLCNSTIKFGVFLDAILAHGMAAMATGHYSRLEQHGDLVRLFRGDVVQRDQSYMLWGLTQAILRHTLFPISGDKSAVRAIARRHNLTIAHKSGSQDICFVRDNYKRFLLKHTEPLPGDIRFKDGRRIGRHNGIQFYTLGQRRGLGIPWNRPLFVMSIDPVAHTLTVTDDLADLARNRFRLRRTNWICGNMPDGGGLAVQVRYNSPPVPVAALAETEDGFEVELLRPEQAVTPGQSAVFFRDNELLGGGVIQS
ncbi:MAG: tRNA 2-thiouridine(34) synthase MnmA [Candidatus Cloacimonetes bacterium]|nr:tRNA 2-thiouridine(34) synthase MnmA [Candidatus Cloacimonadota bacterium]